MPITAADVIAHVEAHYAAAPSFHAHFSQNLVEKGTGRLIRAEGQLEGTGGQTSWSFATGERVVTTAAFHCTAQTTAIFRIPISSSPHAAVLSFLTPGAIASRFTLRLVTSGATFIIEATPRAAPVQKTLVATATFWVDAATFRVDRVVIADSAHDVTTFELSTQRLDAHTSAVFSIAVLGGRLQTPQGDIQATTCP